MAVNDMTGCLRRLSLLRGPAGTLSCEGPAFLEERLGQEGPITLTRPLEQYSVSRPHQLVSGVAATDGVMCTRSFG